jgi:ribosome-associated translation inhibitor RaiA
MHVQVNAERSIHVSESSADEIAVTLRNTLRLFEDEITRVEVHLSDVNAEKGGSDDKRCLLEARLAGLRPITVDHQAGTFAHAIDGAAGKLQRALSSTLGKLRAR